MHEWEILRSYDLSGLLFQGPNLKHELTSLCLILDFMFYYGKTSFRGHFHLPFPPFFPEESLSSVAWPMLHSHSLCHSHELCLMFEGGGRAKCSFRAHCLLSPYDFLT